ncbi:MAG: 50S ribosomal protein L13 [Candidatus Blackburnbacteria bacterium]|nr:50S ribosomal protein L13 [Candidatus Blackburnbacteria bacterium]
MYKTYQPTPKDIIRSWHLYNAEGQILGRLATEVATRLMGKHKPTYSTHMDSGDFVVVINASHVVVTGKKEQEKVYYSHSGYPGGLRARKYSEIKEKSPEKIIQLAVKRMLPVNRLRDDRMNRLKVFAGSKHPFEGKINKKEIK